MYRQCVIPQAPTNTISQSRSGLLSGFGTALPHCRMVFFTIGLRGPAPKVVAVEGEAAPDVRPASLSLSGVFFSSTR